MQHWCVHRGNQKTGKKIGVSHDLAKDLWNTGYHEARLLAILIMDTKSVDFSFLDGLMKDIISWDLCDHICKNLIIKLPDYDYLIQSWCDDSRLYYKRAVFSLIATTVLHNKNIGNENIEKYLDIIKHHSDDNRMHVKKAISWALREIGKKDHDFQEKAMMIAYELCASSNKNKIWIGKNALKELETLVSVKERGRLISSNSKMGRLNDKLY